MGTEVCDEQGPSEQHSEPCRGRDTRLVFSLSFFPFPTAVTLTGEGDESKNVWRRWMSLPWFGNGNWWIRFVVILRALHCFLTAKSYLPIPPTLDEALAPFPETDIQTDISPNGLSFTVPHLLPSQSLLRQRPRLRLCSQETLLRLPRLSWLPEPLPHPSPWRTWALGPLPVRQLRKEEIWRYSRLQDCCEWWAFRWLPFY